MGGKLDILRDELRPGDGVMVEMSYNEWDWGNILSCTQTGFLVEFWPQHEKKFQKFCPRETVYPDDYTFDDVVYTPTNNTSSTSSTSSVSTVTTFSAAAYADQLSNADDQLYVFVYGTLKKGGRLHGHMKGAEFIGKDLTVDKKYGMFSCADMFPAVTNWKSSCAIQGEVYKITRDMLKRLDEVEGVPNLFKREKIWTKNLDKHCFIYLASIKLESTYENEFGSHIYYDEATHSHVWEN